MNMRPVITISLNGNAYQIEQGGHDALRAYLATAAARLAGNPDRAEILADLEQAIAEKCSRFLGSHKSVVTDEEIEQVLREMGPVDGGAEEGDAPQGASSRAGVSDRGAAAAADQAREGHPFKRLYRIREGAMVSGVCTGLAAYFNADVSIVRLIFVPLTLLTGGVWILAYIILTIVVPYAETAEQRAAAQGWEFNAQELIDRAKQYYAQFKDGQHWRRQWRAERRFWRSQQREWQAQARAWRRAHRSLSDAEPCWGSPAQAMGHPAHVLGGVLLPIVTLFNVLLFAALVLAIVSLVTSHAIFGWALPQQLPLWIGILALVVFYSIVASPLRAVSHLGYYGPWAGGWFVLWGALVWMALISWLAWLAWLHWPEVQHFLNQLGAALPGSAGSGTSI
jgi:phage shock protein PspC (stress-responsive transcriptional regulator)